MLKINVDECDSKPIIATKKFFLDMKKHEYTYKTDIELSKIYGVSAHEMRLIIGIQLRNGNINRIWKNYISVGYVFRGCDVPNERLLKAREQLDMMNKLASSKEKEWIKY